MAGFLAEERQRRLNIFSLFIASSASRPRVPLESILRQLRALAAFVHRTPKTELRTRTAEEGRPRRPGRVHIEWGCLAFNSAFRGISTEFGAPSFGNRNLGILDFWDFGISWRLDLTACGLAASVLVVGFMPRRVSGLRVSPSLRVIRSCVWRYSGDLAVKFRRNVLVHLADLGAGGASGKADFEILGPLARVLLVAVFRGFRHRRQVHRSGYSACSCHSCDLAWCGCFSVLRWLSWHVRSVSIRPSVWCATWPSCQWG